MILTESDIVFEARCSRTEGGKEIAFNSSVLMLVIHAADMFQAFVTIHNLLQLSHIYSSETLRRHNKRTGYH